MLCNSVYVVCRDMMALANELDSPEGGPSLAYVAT